MPLQKDIDFIKERLDAILKWLEAPSPYSMNKKWKISEFNKALGYEYARQQVFEILIKHEVKNNE